MTAAAQAARALAPYLAELARRVRDIDPVEADIIRSAARICIETVDGELFPSDVVASAKRAFDRIEYEAWEAARPTWPVAPARCRLGWERAQSLLKQEHDAEWQALSENSDLDDDVTPYKHRAAAVAYWMSLVDGIRWHA